MGHGYIRHIMHTHLTLRHRTWCGRRQADDLFQDLDHAAYNALRGNYYVACRKCVAAACKALRQTEAVNNLPAPTGDPLVSYDGPAAVGEFDCDSRRLHLFLGSDADDLAVTDLGSDLPKFLGEGWRGRVRVSVEVMADDGPEEAAVQPRTVAINDLQEVA